MNEETLEKIKTLICTVMPGTDVLVSESGCADWADLCRQFEESAGMKITDYQGLQTAKRNKQHPFVPAEDISFGGGIFKDALGDASVIEKLESALPVLEERSGDKTFAQAFKIARLPSRFYRNRYFRLYFGISLSEFRKAIEHIEPMTSEALKEAKLLMRETQDRGELTRIFGYDNWYAFSKSFQLAHGRFPGQYIRDDLIVDRAVDLLENTNISIPDIAELVGYSQRKHLTKLIKIETGMTPEQYREWCRIEQGKQLLADTNDPISDIAKQLYYEDEASFTRLFTSRVGVSPRKYRINCKVEHARGLLSETEMSIEDVSERLYFATPQAFYAFFVREEGVSPTIYRERCKVEQGLHLLKETGREIADIAYELGYSERRGFSKLIKRHTGLFPIEHRKNMHLLGLVEGVAAHKMDIHHG